MTLAAFFGSALPYALVSLIAAVALLYFRKIQPWVNRVVKPFLAKLKSKRRARNERRWDIHAR